MISTTNSYFQLIFSSVQATTSSSDTLRKPQFVSVLPPDSMEKMVCKALLHILFYYFGMGLTFLLHLLLQQIPSMFVQRYIPKEHLNCKMAVVFSPIAKTSQIVVEINQTVMFFVGGWSQFLEFHDITHANCLRLRYEGNMVFTVKVFEPNGCERESEKEGH